LGRSTGFMTGCGPFWRREGLRLEAIYFCRTDLKTAAAPIATAGARNW
jgi:hypothetical protein